MASSSGGSELEDVKRKMDKVEAKIDKLETDLEGLKPESPGWLAVQQRLAALQEEKVLLMRVAGGVAQSSAQADYLLHPLEKVATVTLTLCNAPKGTRSTVLLSMQRAGISGSIKRISPGQVAVVAVAEELDEVHKWAKSIAKMAPLKKVYDPLLPHQHTLALDGGVSLSSDPQLLRLLGVPVQVAKLSRHVKSLILKTSATDISDDPEEAVSLASTASKGAADREVLRS